MDFGPKETNICIKLYLHSYFIANIFNFMYTDGFFQMAKLGN